MVALLLIYIKIHKLSDILNTLYYNLNYVLLYLRVMPFSVISPINKSNKRNWIEIISYLFNLNKVESKSTSKFMHIVLYMIRPSKKFPLVINDVEYHQLLEKSDPGSDTQLILYGSSLFIVSFCLCVSWEKKLCFQFFLSILLFYANAIERTTTTFE